MGKKNSHLPKWYVKNRKADDKRIKKLWADIKRRQAVDDKRIKKIFKSYGVKKR